MIFRLSPSWYVVFTFLLADIVVVVKSELAVCMYDAESITPF
jgi:hypothetical protein